MSESQKFQVYVSAQLQTSQMVIASMQIDIQVPVN